MELEKSAAASPIRTHWMARPGRPAACHRITPFRTSCGSPNPAADVACRAFGQPFRHCRRHDPHGSPNAEPYAYVWHRYIRIVGRGQRQHVQQAAHRCYRWQPGPYAQPVRGQLRGRRQPAAVLFRALCDPRLSGGRRGVEGGGRVFPALWAARPSRSSSWPAINIQCEVRGMPLAVLVAGELVSGRRPQPPAPSVALNPIRTRWMEHLGRRPPCLRIMPFRTSCGRPDPAAGVVCGTMTRCFRHCWGGRVT